MALGVFRGLEKRAHPAILVQALTSSGLAGLCGGSGLLPPRCMGSVGYSRVQTGLLAPGSWCRPLCSALLSLSFVAHTEVCCCPSLTGWPFDHHPTSPFVFVLKSILSDISMSLGGPRLAASLGAVSSLPVPLCLRTRNAPPVSCLGLAHQGLFACFCPFDSPCLAHGIDLR